MKILIGPDSFKDSISAHDFTEIVSGMINRYWPEDEVISLPLGDGGEGTADVIINNMNGTVVEMVVTGPLGEKRMAHYGLINKGKIAIIEMATASGLELVPKNKRNPMKTTTYGTGEMILDALERTCEQIIVFIGGSATNDGGLGMMQALGFQCLDKKNNAITYGGEGLITLHEVIRPQDSEFLNQIKETTFIIACDVTNPLCGENGASKVYGPQKGADSEMIQILDEGLGNMAKIIKRDLKKEIALVPGSGAAGGLGGGLLAALNGQLKPGFEVIRGILNLDEILDDHIDLVITGEGHLDHQSLNGKLPMELAKMANERGIKTLIFVGEKEITLSELLDYGIIGIYPIVQGPTTLERAIEEVSSNLKESVFNVLNTIKKFKV